MSKKMYYMERLMKALSDGHITGGVVMPNVKHDDWCGALKKNPEPCTCVPEITVETEGGYIEIDENGNVSKRI